MSTARQMERLAALDSAIAEMAALAKGLRHMLSDRPDATSEDMLGAAMCLSDTASVIQSRAMDLSRALVPPSGDRAAYLPPVGARRYY